jgi:hypothetical protein
LDRVDRRAFEKIDEICRGKTDDQIGTEERIDERLMKRIEDGIDERLMKRTEERSEKSRLLKRPQEDRTAEHPVIYRKQGQPRPIQGQLSPVSEQPSPVNGQSSPIQGQSSSIQVQSSPVNGQPSPVNGQPSPVNGQLSPVNGQPSPIQGQASPMPSVQEQHRVDHPVVYRKQGQPSPILSIQEQYRLAEKRINENSRSIYSTILMNSSPTWMNNSTILMNSSPTWMNSSLKWMNELYMAANLSNYKKQYRLEETKHCDILFGNSIKNFDKITSI